MIKIFVDHTSIRKQSNTNKKQTKTSRDNDIVLKNRLMSNLILFL